LLATATNNHPNYNSLYFINLSKIKVLELEKERRMASYLSNTAYGGFSNGNNGGYQSASQPTSNRDGLSAAITPMYQTVSNFAMP
jgi:hypothetical protein